MNADPLITTMLDLTRAIARADFKLILGGGFGLYLKQLHRQNETGVRTLVSGEFWPQPRATEDLDVFLPTEIVIDLGQMQALRSALDALQFQQVEEARFLQFSKPWGDGGGRIKIDLLTGPIDDAALAALRFTRPRVRPRGQLNLHAYLTDEAIDFDTSLLPLDIEGIGSNGQQGTVTVYIPQPFTFLLMKLHAFADRTEDHDRDLGRHHALDVYRIVAMLTADEYPDVQTKVALHDGSSAVERARQIVADLFSSPTALGAIRVREHRLYTDSMHLGPFLSALDDLFHR